MSMNGDNRLLQVDRSQQGENNSYFHCLFCFSARSMHMSLTKRKAPQLFCTSCATRVYLNKSVWDLGPSLWWHFLDQQNPIALRMFINKHGWDAASMTIQQRLYDELGPAINNAKRLMAAELAPSLELLETTRNGPEPAVGWLEGHTSPNHHDCVWCLAEETMEIKIITTKKGKRAPTMFCSACLTRVWMRGNRTWRFGPSTWLSFIDRVGAFPLRMFVQEYGEEQGPEDEVGAEIGRTVNSDYEQDLEQLEGATVVAKEI